MIVNSAGLPTTDAADALHWFGQLGRAGVCRVWLRDDLYERLIRCFGGAIPEGAVPVVYGVTVYRKEPRK